MSISVEYIELRKEPRAARQTPVGYAIVTANGECDVSLIDIGHGGAGLLMDRPLSPTQVLRLDGPDGRPREARVCWVRKLRSQYRVGVEFGPATV